MNTRDSQLTTLSYHERPDGTLADAAISAGEAQFHRLIDAMPQIVRILGSDGRQTGVNQRWIDYSGWSARDSLGLGWTALVHPDDLGRVSLFWAQAQAQGQSELPEIDYRLRRADGLYRWMLEAHALAPTDAAGGTMHWLATLTDIDALKKNLESTQKTLGMNLVAGRVAHLGGWALELPENRLIWSDENCRIHDAPPGYQPTLEEGINYFAPEHRPLVMHYLQDCIQRGVAYEFVLPKYTAKGRRIWVRSIGEAVRNAAGDIVRVQGAFQDVTAQKEAEARALALESQLTTTLESITDGFCLIDTDWQFTFINGRAERMLQRQDLRGKNIWQEFPEILGSKMEREYRLAAKVQRTTHFEDFYSPLAIWVDVHVYPTQAGLAIYFQDVTQRYAEQDQLRLLETAVSQLNDIVVIAEVQVAGDESRIVFVNDAFERHTGYSREEALGKTSRFLWGPKTDRAELDRIRVAMAQQQAVRAEIIIYTKAGQERWLETHIAPIADDSGKFTHWVAVERDITERRQQQQEILSLNSELEERVLLRTAQLATANRELESFTY